MNQVNDARDCLLALALGTGLQTALWVWAVWSMYKDCQP